MNRRAIWALPLLFLIAACDRKAGGQTVAVVNKEEVTASELNAELKNAHLPPNLAAGEARAKVVQQLVDRRLLTQQAKADGLDKSPEFLNQERRMTDNLLINMLISRQLNTMQLPTASDITSFEASHPEMFAKREAWTIQQLLYQTPKDPAILAKIAATKTLDQLSQVLVSSGIQVEHNTNKIDTSIVPHDVYVRVISLAPGEPFIIPGGDRSVANVVSAREPMAETTDQARTLALNGIRRAQAEKALADRVKAARSSAKIEYQPGFGPPATK
jgi:peptidyl-prolyl cis-trans isomerase C